MFQAIKLRKTQNIKKYQKSQSQMKNITFAGNKE